MDANWGFYAFLVLVAILMFRNMSTDPIPLSKSKPLTLEENCS